MLDAALNTGDSKIYLYDRDGYPSYIHAYWYSTIAGRDMSRFERLPNSVVPPPGALIVGTEYSYDRCRVIWHIDNFYAYFYDKYSR